MQSKRNQGGFSLFLVMVLMVVIALLVIVTNQSALTEMRISSNDADRKLALNRAEKGLREAEMVIEQVATGKKASASFSEACSSGYCQPAKGSYSQALQDSKFSFAGAADTSIEAWQRCADDSKKNCAGQNGKTVLDAKDKSIETDDKKGRYIIEYLGNVTQSGTSKEIFRITSKAKGDNDDTNVVLQSYVELTYN